MVQDSVMLHTGSFEIESFSLSYDGVGSYVHLFVLSHGCCEQERLC